MFKNTPITHKISSLIGVLSVLAVFIAYEAYSGLKAYEKATAAIELAAKRADYGEKINGLVYAVVMDSRGVYMARDNAEIEKFAVPLLANLEKIRENVAAWEKIVRPENAEEFAALIKASEEFIAFRTETVRLGRTGGAIAARTYGDNDQNRNNRKAFNAVFVDMANVNKADIEKTSAHVKHVHQSTITLIILSTVIGVLLCVVVSSWFMRDSIAKPINGLSNYLKRLANGDFDDVPYLDQKDEIGQMAQSVQILYERLLRERELSVQAEKQKDIDAEYRSQMEAIRKSQAVIEFDLDGNILEANNVFLQTMGYTRADVLGKHHSMFVTPGYDKTQEYKDFWNSLRAGEYNANEFKRIGNNGKEVWIQATYNPIFNEEGKPVKVIKFATDVTERKLGTADSDGQINAINKSQAVIHFDMNGHILHANDIFMDFMGYRADEIQDKHHAMFVDPQEAESHEYKEFWNNLRAGNFDARVFKRITKSGREVWIQASYNPIFDLNGKPFKVVKYATDVTDMITLTDQTGENVRSVAAATEELVLSINEISNNMMQSKQATNDIVGKIKISGTASENLVSTTHEMANIVNLIRDIAEQVNLLALNATIEAARAGDAGKGFSVVASEVKNLATQTASATDDIAKEINKIQVISNEVAETVRDIIGSADSVNHYVGSVASAIEEQSIIVKDISNNSQNTSDAVTMISNKIKKSN